MRLGTKFIKHLCLVSKHKWYVFKLSIKAGIPVRGFLHDFSKFSPTEFFESVKYYNGKRSPLRVCRETNGYSKAWLHHKGRNKHHLEYWEDLAIGLRIGVFMPYKYLVEALCDKIAAGMAYKGEEWNCAEPIEYWLECEKNVPIKRHPATEEFIETVFTKIKNEGIDAGLNKKFLQKLYSDLLKKYDVKPY